MATLKLHQLTQELCTAEYRHGAINVLAKEDKATENDSQVDENTLKNMIAKAKTLDSQRLPALASSAVVHHWLLLGQQ